jgi:hypothetical protein
MMNLKLRRLVRTPRSEQYALFDLDQTDDEYNPVSIGKIDLHYTPDAAYGTFLLWKDPAADLPGDQIHALVRTLLEELCEPAGLPAFYAVEFFAPDLESYALYSNEGKKPQDAEDQAPRPTPARDHGEDNTSEDEKTQ